LAALWLDELAILDPVAASWDTVGADHIARDAAQELKDAGILEIVTTATVLSKYERPFAEAIRRDMADRDFLICVSQARDKLGWMARRIEAEPWSEEFAKELEHKTIPDIADALTEAGRARDSWFKTGRGRSILKATGIAVGAATAILAFFPTPATPVAWAVAGLGVISGAAVPGAEQLLEWRGGKKSVQENGLHYLLKV